MSLTLKIPYSYVTEKPTLHEVIPVSGTVSDIMTDNRPLPVHTKKATWRPPTAYYRQVESGNVKTFQLNGQFKYSVSGTPFITTFTGGADFSGFYGDALPSPPINMENQAIIKARLKLKSQTINLGNAFGERAQTARLVGDNLRRLANLVDHVKRRNFFLPGNRRPKPEDFFDYWLELQYGWKPLLSDCYGAAKALEDREKERGNNGIVTVKAAAQSNDFSSKTISQSVQAIKVACTKTMVTRHKGFIRLDFVQDSPLLASLSQLGLTNPLEIAWELTPWSFVADWFLPIGDYLDSLDATVGWTFKGGSWSVKSTRKSRAMDGRWGSNPSYKLTGGYAIASGDGYQMQFTRKVYSTAPLPSLPSFHKLNSSSVDHVNNGIALLMSAITGKARVR